MESTTTAWTDPTDSRLPRCLVFAALITASADRLFYQSPLGASVAVFAGIILVALLVNRRPLNTDTVSLAILLLIPGAAFQAIIEVSFSNILVLSLLLTALAGQTFYDRLPQAWMRWVEALLALFKSIGRWFWVFGELSRSERGLFQSVIWWTRAILPAFVLTVIFTSLLAFGNVILGHVIEKTWNTIIRDIVFPPFTRVLLWAGVATLSLAVLHPALTPVARRFWFGKPPVSIPRDAVSLNSMRSVLILVILNVLFLAANTIDAIYLWMSATLPSDVTYAQYVHNGVYNLSTCAVISALVLTGMFDQSRQVTSGRWTRILAIAWIAQNIFLVASVALRLKLYVDAYQLSSLRIYAGLFLLLVCVGFILLAIKILREKSFHWLVLGNALATFALFYSVQFLNVDGWVANYNVQRWIQKPDRPLDVEYLKELGAPAWPALQAAAEDPRNLPGSLEARSALKRALASEGYSMERRSWKSWQWRRAEIYQELVSR